MEKSTLKRGCLIFLAAYIICVVAVYFIAGNQFQYNDNAKSIETVDGKLTAGEIAQNFTIKQTFIPHTDSINKVSIKFGTYSRKNDGTLKMQLMNTSTREVLFSKDIDLSDVKDDVFMDINIDKPIQGIKGDTLAIVLSSLSIQKTNAATVFYNNSVTLQDQQLFFNNQPVSGVMNYSVYGRQALWFGHYYFILFFVIGVLLSLYCIHLNLRYKNGKKSIGLTIINSYIKYKFLLSQLVNRDFKTKYKRSVLGLLWSFLNPLLSMMVQYVIFSTIFRSNIPNFAVYLLMGIVLFNYFTESCGNGLTSIVWNAPLITKVYIPKYIFPISRVFSSAINLLLSFIPLLIVILITRTAITPAILLMPYVIACLILFCIGMSMLLSSLMVFFRDMQFIWSVISMLWMYATPLFYPSDIIPLKYRFVLDFNPMYHFISFGRILVLQGISPGPLPYLLCLIAALVPFFLGMLVFKKTQDKFILYI